MLAVGKAGAAPEVPHWQVGWLGSQPTARSIITAGSRHPTCTETQGSAVTASAKCADPSNTQ